MIPLKDENPSRTIPIVNIFFVLANIVVFIYIKYIVVADNQQLFLQLGFIPYEISHLADINPKDLVPIPLTIFTSMFIHGGWLHLLSNMLYLWIFGDNIEDRLGHVKYLFFYLLCGFFAALLHGLVHINSKVPSVGASGAIAGVLGAYLLFYPKAHIKTLFIVFVFAKIIRLPAMIVLGFWIVAQVMSAYAEYGLHTGGGGIGWFAHIGGFLSGLILATMVKNKRMSLLPGKVS